MSAFYSVGRFSYSSQKRRVFIRSISFNITDLNLLCNDLLDGEAEES